MNTPLFIGSNGEVAAVSADTGQEIWRTSLGKGFLDTFAVSEQDVAVLAHGPYVFAGCNGHLFCLDAATGEIRWHNPLKGMGWNDVTLSIEGKSIQIVSRLRPEAEADFEHPDSDR